MGPGHVAGPCLGTTAEEGKSKDYFTKLSIILYRIELDFFFKNLIQFMYRK